MSNNEIFQISEVDWLQGLSVAGTGTGAVCGCVCLGGGPGWEVVRLRERQILCEIQIYLFKKESNDIYIVWKLVSSKCVFYC